MRLPAVVGNLLLATGAVGVALAAAEAGLRLFPRTLLPAGAYGAGVWSPGLRMNVLAPRVVYNKVRFVERTANADGFLDGNHTQKKPAGTLRVGLFGDSYVEAMQVPLEQVFYRRTSLTASGQPVETFGFGVSGWGTLHAFLAFRVFAPRYDLDMVGYVFVENDLGDSLDVIQAAHGGGLGGKPAARLCSAPPGFTLVERYASADRPLWLRAAKQVHVRSLLAQLLQARIELLRQGAHPSATEALGEMSGAPGAAPDPNAPPALWPPSVAELAKELARRILVQFRDETQAQGRRFFILYVPRGEAQLRGDTPLEATWRPWLGTVCRDLGIPLVDPSDALAARLRTGEHVFNDHFSPAGHVVVGDVLAHYLATLPPAPAPGRGPSPRREISTHGD